MSTAGYVVSSTGGEISPLTATEMHYRFPVQIPVTTTQWRLHIQNRRVYEGTQYSNALNFTGVWIGNHFFSFSGGNIGYSAGWFTATPSKALNSFSTPSDGSSYTSPWVSDSTMQFKAGVSHLISTGFTCASSSISAGLGPVVFVDTTAGSSANAGSATPSGLTPTASTTYLDMWIEYQFSNSKPVGIVIGDSLSAGYSGAGCQVQNSWPHRMSLRTGCPIINASHYGLGFSHYAAGSSNGLWSRFSGIQPDFAIIALGTNDYQGGASLATTKSNCVTVMDIPRNYMNTQRVYMTTITPRGATGTIESNRTSHNSWLEDGVYGSEGLFDFDFAVRNPSSVSSLLSQYSDDGIHLSNLGYQTLANTAAVNL